MADITKCELCREKCPQAQMAHNAALGRMYATKEFIAFQKKIDEGKIIELPCKIGDYVWAIRNFNGHKHPQRGVVSDMYFTRDMQLNIVVKYVARGKWGETVFATDAEAYAVINGERKEE